MSGIPAAHAETWVPIESTLPEATSPFGPTFRCRCRSVPHSRHFVASWIATDALGHVCRAPYQHRVVTVGTKHGWRLDPWYLAKAKALSVGFPIPISNPSVFLSFSVSEGAISRTAVYGPVRTVVWQASAGNLCPYADHFGMSTGKLGPPVGAICDGVADLAVGAPGTLPAKRSEDDRDSLGGGPLLDTLAGESGGHQVRELVRSVGEDGAER